MALTWNSQKLIDTLIDEAETKINLSFADVILAIRNEHTLTELAAFIAAGQFAEALAVVATAAGKLGTAINSTFIGTGEEVLASLGDKLGIFVSYDQVNVRAVEAMMQNRLELVREFTAGQRDATRQALLNGIRDGANPRAQARAFRDSIGLTQRQVQIIDNYRRDLIELNPRALQRKLRDARFDRTVFDAIDHNSPLSKKQIDQLVGRYRERWIKYRSEVIARTEALSSVHQGADEAITQAIESGMVDPEKARQTWNTAKDERVRDWENGASTSHLSMHGQERAIGEPFTSGAGASIRYPGDPEAPARERIQCRCRVSIRVSL